MPRITPRGGRVAMVVRLVPASTVGEGHQTLAWCLAAWPWALGVRARGGCGATYRLQSLPAMFEALKQSRASDGDRGPAMGLAISRQLAA